jgi:hypothetical protein
VSDKTITLEDLYRQHDKMLQGMSAANRWSALGFFTVLPLCAAKCDVDDYFAGIESLVLPCEGGECWDVRR